MMMDQTLMAVSMGIDTVINLLVDCLLGNWQQEISVHFVG